MIYPYMYIHIYIYVSTGESSNLFLMAYYDIMDPIVIHISMKSRCQKPSFFMACAKDIFLGVNGATTPEYSVDN